jgi:flagellar protein FliL
MSKTSPKIKPEETSPVPVQKKQRLKKLIFLSTIVITLLGVGAGAGLYAASKGLTKPHNTTEKSNLPQLVKRDPESGSGYETTYFALPESFTANLNGSSHYVQLSLSVATHYDDKVIKNIEKHNFAIRSAILAVIGAQDEAVLATVLGKEALQRELVSTINTELKKHENFGGVDSVYFNAFIIQ